MTAKDRASGVWAPALTPLDSQGRPDAERTIAHHRWLLEQGCHGIVLFGTTGEATSFSVAERQALLEVMGTNALRPEQLIVGTGCAALPDTVALTRHSCAQGYRSVLVLPPFYYKGVSDDALFAYFAEVIEQVADSALSVYLYNFPKLSALPFSLALIERLLTAYPHTIRGIKDSSGDADSTSAFITAFPELAVFPGNEILLSDMMALGGAGTITATANVNAAALRRAYDAVTESSANVTNLQAAVTATRSILQGFPLIPALKLIVADMRGDEGWLRLRPPVISLSDAERERLSEAMAGAGLEFAA